MSLAPFKQLQRISEALITQKEFKFCICGGLAASLYRKIPRLTDDLDICIYLLNDKEDAKDKAIKFIEQIGLKPNYGWISFKDKDLSGQICLIIGTNPDSQDCSVDLLLPVFPWLKKAVERAQHNIIDFGFAKLPTITPEDLIISKSFALNHEQTRYQDLDDIKNILKDVSSLDRVYLEAELRNLGISLP